MDFVPLATMKWDSKHGGHEQSLGEDVRFIAGFCSGWQKRYRAPLSITRDLTQLWHQIVPILLFTLPNLNCWRIPTRFCLTSTYKRQGRGTRRANLILPGESNFAGCHSPDLVPVRLPPSHRPQHPHRSRTHSGQRCQVSGTGFVGSSDSAILSTQQRLCCDFRVSRILRWFAGRQGLR